MPVQVSENGMRRLFPRHFYHLASLRTAQCSACLQQDVLSCIPRPFQGVKRFQSEGGHSVPRPSSCTIRIHKQWKCHIALLPSTSSSFGVESVEAKTASALLADVQSLGSTKWGLEQFMPFWYMYTCVVTYSNISPRFLGLSSFKPRHSGARSRDI